MQGSPIPLHPRSRSDRQVHLVTGATGFVGGALALELLARTEDRLVVVVRPGAEGARSRFREALLHAARAYGVSLDAGAIERCQVVAGDVLQPRCGVDADAVGRVDQVWHCAASLRYENRYQQEIRATNVDGTRHVLDLTRDLGASALNHVSTAYVAGSRQGRIAEEAAAEVATNNQYERSKIDAERLVAAVRGLRVRVFRPSVVVGHSATLAATTFSGFYGFVRQLVQFRGMVERTRRGLLEQTALRIRLDPDVGIDLVPVDAVAREAVHIGLQDGAEGVFHLTHRDPPTVGLCVRTIFATLGLHEPIFVGAADELGWLDGRFDERLDFYGSYIRGDKRFARERTDRALGADIGPDALYDADRIEAMARWYLAVLEQERRQLPVAR